MKADISNNNNDDDIGREKEKLDVLVTHRNGVTQGGREEGSVIGSDVQTTNTNSNTNSTQHAVIVDLTNGNNGVNNENEGIR